jgi:hypothetical protein
MGVRPAAVKLLVFLYIMQPSSSLFSQYQTFQNSRVKPEDYVKRYSTDLGIDDAKARVKGARTAIRATEDTIAAAPSSVAGRTSGSLVTDAQRNRLVQNEVAPLQEIMRTQSGAFGDASQDLTSLSSELDKRVGYGLQADDQQANTLLTLYQAASEAEKQAEAKRQWEAQMAEQKRQFDEQLRASERASARAAAAAATPSFGGGKSGGAGASGDFGATDPVQQAAYNDVASRMGQSDAAIKSDYNATLKSAGYGNAKDKIKIQIYHKLRPDLFGGSAVPARAVADNWKDLSY